MTPSPDSAPSKNDRRHAAREKARLAREAQARRTRRNKWLLQGGITAGVLAVIAVTALVIVQATRPTGPGPVNMASDGIVLTAGESGGVEAVRSEAIPAGGAPTPFESPGDAAHIVIYQDFLCPICEAFDTANSEQLEALAESGAATVEIHPIAILDRLSQGTRYATRAANAAACVAEAEPDKFLDVNTAFYAQQPAEGTSGLSDDQIVELVQGAGATSGEVAACIQGGDHEDWVADATARALDGPLPNTDLPAVTGTPTVLVNGEQYQGAVDDPAAFAAFVRQAA
ncbi:thioredoxin domain-containing protein [Rathayibacter sp. AY1A3]|uniref:DsbA family protein n=1 Tax=Rathayibacter sp. AY1A3 TaxID=2080521 RepID=UPI000CE8C450|nr:thioredoxin domain-containing protein [Rathayibacter sp. AY1A3]PPF34382.1 hypothetical protein C5C10_09260 [Rathayibacter sp. AY1A3]